VQPADDAAKADVDPNAAVEKAEAAKARGNAAFAARDFAGAVTHYSLALRLHPTNHVLWSNRSAAHCAVRGPPPFLPPESPQFPPHCPLWVRVRVRV